MINHVGKTIGVFLALWIVWVVWEWKATLQDITAHQLPLPALQSQGERLSLASLGGPIPFPSPKEEGERSQLPPATAGEVPPAPPSLAQTSSEAADKYMLEKKRGWGVRDYHELRPTSYETPLGTKIKYAAYQDGLPIIGSEVMLDVSKDREVSLTENNYLPLKKADLTQPTLDFEAILEKSPSKYKMDLTVTAGVSKIIYASPGSDEPELSYVMAVKENGTGPTENIVFRATDGQVLGRQTARSEF